MLFTNVVLYTGLVKTTSFLFCFLSGVVFCFDTAWNWNLDADISSWWYFWQEDNIGRETHEETAAKNRPTKKKIIPSRFSPRLQEYRIMYPVLHFSTVWAAICILYFTLCWCQISWLHIMGKLIAKSIDPHCKTQSHKSETVLLKTTLSCLPGVATQRFASDGTGLWL